MSWRVQQFPKRRRPILSRLHNMTTAATMIPRHNPICYISSFADCNQSLPLTGYAITCHCHDECRTQRGHQHRKSNSMTILKIKTRQFVFASSLTAASTCTYFFSLPRTSVLIYHYQATETAMSDDPGQPEAQPAHKNRGRPVVRRRSPPGRSQTEAQGWWHHRR